MISLNSLASEYSAVVEDDHGFDLEGENLRLSVERSIRRQLGAHVRTVTALGPLAGCPNAYVGELRSAIHKAHCAERDLDQVMALRTWRAA